MTQMISKECKEYIFLIWLHLRQRVALFLTFALGRRHLAKRSLNSRLSNLSQTWRIIILIHRQVSAWQFQNIYAHSVACRGNWHLLWLYNFPGAIPGVLHLLHIIHPTALLDIVPLSTQVNSYLVTCPVRKPGLEQFNSKFCVFSHQTASKKTTHL